MRVIVERATVEPVEVISRAAGVCYGKEDVSVKRVEGCFKRGHLSVFEHASVTLRVEGVSRACMAQLTRHRLCSFCVESQRYNKYDLSGFGWYVMPPSFEGMEWIFEDAINESSLKYMAALEEGVKPEDARYLLPEATKTNLVMSCNLRELYHLFDMRRDKAAQWEIRELANAIADEVAKQGEGWSFLMGLWG